MDKVFKIGGAILGTAAAGVGAYFGKKAYDKKKKSKLENEECNSAETVAEKAADKKVAE